MELDDYKKIAVNKVVGLFAEQGFKVRAFEINSDKSYRDVLRKNIWIRRQFFAYENRVEVDVRFEVLGERGKQIKKVRNNFLNYFNCRVYDDRIEFTFTKKELEIMACDTSSETHSQVELEKVLDKVSKLLALAGSDNENEALSASLMAQKLLKKYNLDMEQVTGKEKEEEIVECKADVGNGNKWKYQLADVVAKNYCCKCYYSGFNVIVFYGYKSDAIIARRMFAYLFEVGCRLANAFKRKYVEEHGRGDGIYNSFCIGFLSGIKDQLDKQCTALMLVVPEKVKSEFEILAESFETKNINISLTNTEAFYAGETEGKRVLNSHYITER